MIADEQGTRSGLKEKRALDKTCASSIADQGNGRCCVHNGAYIHNQGRSGSLRTLLGLLHDLGIPLGRVLSIIACCVPQAQGSSMAVPTASGSQVSASALPASDQQVVHYLRANDDDDDGDGTVDYLDGTNHDRIPGTPDDITIGENDLLPIHVTLPGSIDPERSTVRVEIDPPEHFRCRTNPERGRLIELGVEHTVRQLQELDGSWRDTVWVEVIASDSSGFDALLTVETTATSKSNEITTASLEQRRLYILSSPLTSDREARAPFLFSPNLNDDELRGFPDCENGSPRTPPKHGLADLTEVSLPKRQSMPSGLRCLLRLREDDAEWVRVFRESSGVVELLLDPATGFDSAGFRYASIPTSDLCDGPPSSRLLLEGRAFASGVTLFRSASAHRFSGEVSLEVVSEIGAQTLQILSPIRLRPRPWVMSSNLDSCRSLWVVCDSLTTGMCGEFETALDKSIAVNLVNLRKIEGAFSSRGYWIQDEFQDGYYWSGSVPVPCVLPWPWRTETLKEEAKFFLQRGAAVAAFGVPSTDSRFDDFGNFETIPPFTDARGQAWPYGRVCYGQGDTPGELPSQQLLDFILAQGVQDPVGLPTSWLQAGHIDEVFTIVPVPRAEYDGGRKFKILIASPREAVRLLESYGDSKRKLPFSDQSAVGLLNDWREYNLSTLCQPKIDEIRGKLESVFGFDSTDFVEVPVLFDQHTKGRRGARSLTPNLVNLVVVNSQLLIPDPLDKRFRDNLVSKLRALGYETGNPPRNSIAFINCWDTYHDWIGELHCATNASRSPRGDWTGDRLIGAGDGAASGP